MSAVSTPEPEPVGAVPRDDWPVEAVTAVELLTTAVRGLRERTDQLQHALDSRIVIEQAKGVLAERHGLGTDRAFELLRRSARSAQMPLHDLARSVVESPTNPAPVARELARLHARPPR